MYDFATKHMSKPSKYTSLYICLQPSKYISQLPCCGMRILEQKNERMPPTVLGISLKWFKTQGLRDWSQFQRRKHLVSEKLIESARRKTKKYSTF